MVCYLCAREFQVPERVVQCVEAFPIAPGFPDAVLVPLAHGDCAAVREAAR